MTNSKPIQQLPPKEPQEWTFNKCVYEARLNVDNMMPLTYCESCGKYDLGVDEFFGTCANLECQSLEVVEPAKYTAWLIGETKRIHEEELAQAYQSGIEQGRREEREKINILNRKYNKNINRMKKSKHRYHLRIGKQFTNCDLCIK